MDTLALHRPFRTLYCMLPALSRPLAKHYSCETLQRTEANTWKWWHAGCIASTPVARSPLVNFSSFKCISNIQEKSEYIRLLETLGVGHLSRSSSWAVVGHRVEIGCGRLSFHLSLFRLLSQSLPSSELAPNRIIPATRHYHAATTLVIIPWN